MRTCWFLARTKPNRERYAEKNILRQSIPGLQTWLPIIEGDRGKEEMLFPTYLFFRSYGQWRFIEGTYGCTGVIMRGETADVVHHRVMRQLRGLVKSVNLPPPPPRLAYTKGEKVVIVGAGPFRGIEGSYLRTSPEKRIWILLDILSKKVPVEQDPRDVRAVA